MDARGGAGLAFRVSLATLQPLDGRNSRLKIGRGMQRAVCAQVSSAPRHWVALERQAAGYAFLCNPCKRAFLGTSPWTPAPPLGGAGALGSGV